MIRKSIAVLLLGCVLPTVAKAQQRRIDYEVSFPNRAQHEARVTAIFHGVPVGSALEARMAKSSPGRYAITSFAKNVYDVVATDGRGRALAITRPDLHGWDVKGHDGTVKLSYTVWGDRADGTYLQIDHSHAHMNIPATFMFAHGMTNVPISLKINAPPGWQVGTQLVPTSNPFMFTAPNMQWFMDSPTEVSPLMWSKWDETRGGRKYTWRIAMHHLGTQAQLDAFAPMLRRVVDEQIAIFGEPARYDLGRYTFLVDYLPWVQGDAMEHRNSTFVTSSRNNISDSARRVTALESNAHEFVHSWNMERIRSKGIEPFDFERENMSRDLWLGEGFTNYLEPLSIRRAGFYTDEQFINNMGGELIGTINAPGRNHRSAVEMSMLAPFVDGSAFRDPMNTQGTFISYYTWGSIIALSLDLILRTRFTLTLDDYMKALWTDFGVKQNAAWAPERPYVTSDLRAELGKLTKDTAFANDFFRRYVEGREVPDLAPMLARAGFRLAADSVVKPWIGASMDNDSNYVFINWSAEGSSAYQAGLSSGDLVYAIDGKRVNSMDSLSAIINRHNVGDVVQLDVNQREQRRTIPMKLVGRPKLTITTYEKAGLPVTPEIRGFREWWLGSKAATVKN